MIRGLVLLFIVVGGSVTAVASGGFNSQSTAVTSLFQAIAKAQPHDTLVIAAGKYNLKQKLVIDKPLTLLGKNKVTLYAAPQKGLIEITADSVTISGFHLKDVGRSYTEDLAAIWINETRHVNIVNNRISNCFFAIFATRAKVGIIRNNTISGNAVDEYSSANAIHLWYCDSLTVNGNTVQNHRDGIYLEFTNNSVINNNVSRNNLRYGLHFMFSDHDSYAHNIFEKNGAGVAVMFSNYIKMVGNTFRQNWGSASYGLLLKEIYDSEITGNLFKKNTTGILAEGSTRVIFQNNRFLNNGWAIKMRGSAMENELLYNDFIGNSFHLASDKTTSTNDFHHNYWDDYDGYDLNHDGVGDIPHRPVNLFSYLVSRSDASILLLRSTFIEVLNVAERVAPAVTPENLEDATPLMNPHNTPEE